MAVVQPPNQLEELEHLDEVLLQELQRMDELLLEELERVDEMLLRIVAAIDQLPVRIASTIRRKQLGSVSGNGTRAAEPARTRGPLDRSTLMGRTRSRDSPAIRSRSRRRRTKSQQPGRWPGRCRAG